MVKAEIIKDKLRITYEKTIEDFDPRDLMSRYCEQADKMIMHQIAVKIADQIHGKVFENINMDAIIRLTEIEVAKNLGSNQR